MVQTIPELIASQACFKYDNSRVYAPNRQAILSTRKVDIVYYDSMEHATDSGSTQKQLVSSKRLRCSENAYVSILKII